MNNAGGTHPWLARLAGSAGDGWTGRIGSFVAGWTADHALAGYPRRGTAWEVKSGIRKSCEKRGIMLYPTTTTGEIGASQGGPGGCLAFLPLRQSHFQRIREIRPEIFT